MRTVAEQEEPESEPKADAIRGTAAIIRRISNARQNMEAKEARRVHEERMKEQAQLETLGENETYEWDGLRRRKTTMSSDHTGGSTSLRRQKTLHPPLGMTHFPPAEDDPQHADARYDDDDSRPLSSDVHGSSPNLFGHSRFLPSFRRRKDSLPTYTRTVHAAQPAAQNRAHLPQRPLTEIVLPGGKSELDVGVDTAYHSAGGAPGPGESTDSLELTTRSGNAAAGAGGERPSHRPIQWADDSNTGRARGASSTSTLRPPPKSPGALSTSSLAPTPPPHSGTGAGAGTKRQFSFQNVFSRHRASSTTYSQTDGPAPDTISTSTTAYPRDRSGTGADEDDRLPRARLGIGSRDSERSYPGQDAATEEERLGLVKGDTKMEAESDSGGGSAVSERSSEDMVVVREKSGGYGGVRML